MTTLRETFFDVDLDSLLLPVDAVVISAALSDKSKTIVVYYTSKYEMFRTLGVPLKRIPLYTLNVGDEVPDCLIGSKPLLVDGKRFLFLNQETK